MTIRIRGILYHFEVYGDKPEKPWLVLLHGFLGSGDNFTPLIPALQEFCNPVTIDLLGHGKSEGAELHYRFSAREQIADVAKLINEQLHHPLYLYGYSMGGRLALQLALQKSVLLRGLILESSTFGIEHETERQARQALDAHRSEQIIGNYRGFLEDWGKMPLFGNPVSPTVAAILKTVQQNQHPLWMANSLLGFGSGTMPAVRKQLPELNLPVQLIVGEQDTKFLHINRQMQREMENAKLEVVPEASHRVHLEQPGKVVEIIKLFIQ